LRLFFSQWENDPQVRQFISFIYLSFIYRRKFLAFMDNNTEATMSNLQIALEIIFGTLFMAMLILMVVFVPVLFVANGG